jgi:CSLREA domain-containing protein
MEMKSDVIGTRYSSHTGATTWTALIFAIALMIVSPAGLSHAQGLLFDVNTTGDGDDVNVGDGLCADSNGDCTLRAAIHEANFHAGDDGIEFDLAITDPNFDGTKWFIPLTMALPDIGDHLSITGPGADKLTVRLGSGGPYRIFGVLTTSVTLSGLTISGGDAGLQGGGAIQSPVTGTLDVNNCTLSGNQALIGGAVANLGNATVNLTDCTLIENVGSFEGGAIMNDHGTVTLTNCIVSFNTSNSGGAFFCDVGSTTNIINCTISYNSAVGAPGAGGNGGGAYSQGGTLVVSGSTFMGNSADDDGGGISRSDPGALVLTLSTLKDNTAVGSGGGLSTTSTEGFIVSVVGCTVSGNSAALGGGIQVSDGSLELVNSTVSNNTTIAGTGNGAGIRALGGPPHFFVVLTNSTIASNATALGAGAKGGGISNESSEPIFVKNCLIALNLADVGPDVSGNFASTLTFTSEGFNLVGKTDGGAGFTAATDLTGTIAAPLDPKLDPNGLLDNGGPTQTIALLVGSPAIDQATSDGLRGSLTTDQRGPGFPRTFDQPLIPNAAGGDGTDIGAFELETTPSTFANISTRERVETGDNVLIGGFIITGTDPKKVLLRAIGPSLPLSGFLADPTIELHDEAGAVIALNDNWQNNLNKQEIIDTGIPPPNDLESALLVTLSPNAYTAIVKGVNDGTGIALVEVYDLDATVDSHLANISTRGLVQTGDDVMIGGIIILGTDAQEVLLRAIGPSLPLTGALADPTLELHDMDGVTIATNDDWRSDQEADIMATGIPPTDDVESAILMTLTPDAYTAIVRGKDNTTGVALVEAYQLDN